MTRSRAAVLLFPLLFSVSCASPPERHERDAVSSGSLEEGPLVVGFFADMSGPGAHDGNEALQAVQMEIASVNASGGAGGRLVQLVTADSGSTPVDAVTAYLQLARDGRAAAVIGSWNPNACLAVAPVAEAEGVPLVTHCADYRAVTPELTPGRPPDLTSGRPSTLTPARPSAPRAFSFLSRPAALDTGALLAGYALDELGFFRLAVLSRSGVAVSAQQAEGFALYAASHGGRVLLTLEMSDGEGQAAEAMDKVRQVGADCLLLSVGVSSLFGESLPGPSIRAVIVGDEWWPRAAVPLPEAHGAHAFCQYDLDGDTAAGFTRRYRAAYGAEPGTHAMAARDDLALILEAAWKSGSRMPPALRDALEAIEGFEALAGTVTMGRATHRPLPMPVSVFSFRDSGSERALRYLPRDLRPARP